MKQLFTLLLFLLTSTIFATAQTLSGYIKDAQSGEPLIGANIYVPSLKIGGTSNIYGFYSLKLPIKKDLTATVSFVGYESDTIHVFLENDKVLNLSLKPSTTLEGIEVVANSNFNNDKIGTIILPVKQVEALPNIGSEPDVLKAVQLLPGVKFGNEGTTGLYVRGGGADQNLILLDGIPVYNASHLFGFLSIFNTSSINHIELIKGGFPARYGGRLASVLDIRTKEGNMETLHGEATLGIIASKIMVEGPIIKNKMSFSVAARRSLYEAYTLPVKWMNSSSEENLFSNYYFYDINAKLNYRFSEKDRIYLSFYQGQDKINIVETLQQPAYKELYEQSISWGNQIGSFRWNHLFNNHLFSNLTLWSNRYAFQIGTNSNLQPIDTTIQGYEYVFNYQSKVKDWGGRMDFYYQPSNQHSIKFGGEAVHHTFTPGVTAYISSENVVAPTDTTPQNNTIAQEARVYLEDNFRIADNFQINIGGHFSLFNVNKKIYHSIEPRLSANYQATSNISIQAAYSQMKQYLHLLSNSGLGVPTDLWISPTENVAPQQSWQVSTGVSFQNKNKDLQITVEGYYKAMKGLIDYKEGASFLLNGSNWENQIVKDGIGDAYGAEFFIQKTNNKLTTWLGYTLSWSNRQFENINNGNPYPYKYDRRHDLSLVAFYKIKKNIEISGTWVFATGNALTLPKSVYPSTIYPPDIIRRSNFNNSNILDLPIPNIVSRNPTEIFDYDGKNSSRMPNYHRLDLAVNFHKKTKRGERTINVSVYNVYNRKNPYFVRYVFKGDSFTNSYSGKGTFETVSLLQIIPSVSYTLKF
jgi:hypothetical protein